MRAVVTVEQMRAADAEALRSVTEATLVARAGTAVAAAAIEMLGGAYGRRVLVIAGPGNNGADGRIAATVLRRRGASVVIVGSDTTSPLPPADLVIDAAYGTGFRGRYGPPRVPDGVPVLAVDIPSGVSGDVGTVEGAALRARRTVTFAALKIGLVQGEGPLLAGDVTVADIGIAMRPSGIGVVEDSDVAASLPRRPAHGHKWETSVAVVAGSPGMEGAPALCAEGASHAGAGMVRLAVPGTSDAAGASGAGPWPLEAVRLSVGRTCWAGAVLEQLDRLRAVVVGPGLGRAEETRSEVARLVAGSRAPVVVDADGLVALGDLDTARRLITASGRPVVLTPHDGEYRMLAGHPPGPDRRSAALHLAEATGAVVLLKGSPTVVARPGSAEEPADVRFCTAGSARLATAGTGDVLAGMIGAFLARGLDALDAAAFAAHVHGRAASCGNAEGLVAGDVPGLVSAWLSARVGGG